MKNRTGHWPWNGFFNLSGIKDIETLKQLYRDALAVADSYHVDILKGWTRETYPELSAEDYIENYITLNTHNVVIDRFAYNRHAEWADQQGEIGSSTMGKSPDVFLFINLSLENLYEIVDKYKLSKKD